MSFAAQAMLRNVERALRPAESTAIDSVESIREELIRWRDKALDLKTFNAGAAVVLSHAIAHLARLKAVEDAMRPKESR